MNNPIKSPLSIQNLTVRYTGQNNDALHDISFDFENAKMTAIIGPNGAGKSTLLKAVLGLIPIQSGSIHFYGEDLNKIRKNIAYVPQRANIDWNFPISVKEVVQQGLFSELKFTDIFTPKRHKELALQALAKVGIENMSDRQISKLSGGQQQRMFLARALVQNINNYNKQLYILDEPFTGVDATTEKVIVDILKHLTNEGHSVIAVHHNLATVPDYFDNVALINTNLIAHGSVKQVYTDEAISRTYIPLNNKSEPQKRSS